MSALKQSLNHLERLYKATGYSLAGLKSVYRHEQVFRLEFYILVFLVPAAILLAQTVVELFLLIASWIFVMIVEMLNSAIEATVDRIGFENHDLSGRAKDIGSAAVMVSIFLSVFTWIAVVFGQFST